MTSDPPTNLDLFRVLRDVRAWAALAVPIVGGIATVLWMMHQVAQAQAVDLAKLEVRQGHLEFRLAKIDDIARDVSAIKQALGVEQGWRRGLLQSLPGGEGEK